MKRLVALIVILVVAAWFVPGCAKNSPPSAATAKPEEVQIPPIPPEVQKQLGVKPAPTQKAK